MRDVLDPLVAELAVAQAGHRVVLVEALLGLGGRLDVPGDQRRVQGLGHLVGQHRLAGAGLALDQQRPLQRDGGVDRDLQVVGGDVVAVPSKRCCPLAGKPGRIPFRFLAPFPATIKRAGRGRRGGKPRP